ncbi:glycoside hydrolase family 31 protein [Schleiferilactobacillus shenzhenensis]|uniref:AgdC n=1 Tax=Schleiferilactobacillus shenzhenensis LY-73 TaxID=1231336 RepID=U4TSH3_9LACO|nr:glycoside hydrolase family 31 protein [Schleiferilactobacillus shenzhenensis]ERL64818.1 AgdC [Schleiferilactobacillus shenzhenensis LY-73]
MSKLKELRSTLTDTVTLPIQEGEYWYGGCVMDGPVYPFTRGADYRLDMINLNSPNQVAPSFLSTHGRAIWSNEPFSLRVVGDNMEIITRSPLFVDDSGKNLKDAQQTLAKHVFALGKMPPAEFFRMAQWNDWIELLYKQNQADVLKYAHGIVDHGFPAGIIMIDDLWAEYYGRWAFSVRKFPDAPAMVKELHNLGFKVMVWVCPFITPDTPEFHYLRDHHMLTENSSGAPVIRQWWNGYGALLDLSNPDTRKWLSDALHKVEHDTGVDGFKFDAGDPQFYDDNDVTRMHLTKTEGSQLWGQFGLNFPYNEYRVNFKNQGAPLVNRLQDKSFEWGTGGLSELIPDTLTQGLLGYYYNCPDMIGGGEYLSFLGKKGDLDQELIVRSAQCAALMAMMQFSVAPWRVLDKKHLDLCIAAAKLHTQYADYILALAQNAAKTGEPITRPMVYDYPETPLQFVKTQFMLGDKLLVAPVLEKGATTKTVYFPAGQWQSINDAADVVTGSGEQTVPADLSTLPAYKKID